MPEIHIRPAQENDIPALANLEHDYTSEYAWQLDASREEGELGALFRKIHLPRAVRVAYPHPRRALLSNWQSRHGLLAAEFEGQPIGYISLSLENSPGAAWTTDLVVAQRLRRQGIASALALAGCEWAAQHGCVHLILVTQPKNHAAICLAEKLGFAFCGYNDRYYLNQDLGFFFARQVR